MNNEIASANGSLFNSESFKPNIVSKNSAIASSCASVVCDSLANTFSFPISSDSSYSLDNSCNVLPSFEIFLYSPKDTSFLIVYYLLLYSNFSPIIYKGLLRLSYIVYACATESPLKVHCSIIASSDPISPSLA